MVTFPVMGTVAWPLLITTKWTNCEMIELETPANKTFVISLPSPMFVPLIVTKVPPDNGALAGKTVVIDPFDIRFSSKDSSHRSACNSACSIVQAVMRARESSSVVHNLPGTYFGFLALDHGLNSP